MWSRRNGETLWLRQPTAMARRLPNILEWNLFRTLNCIEPAQILGLIHLNSRRCFAKVRTCPLLQAWTGPTNWFWRVSYSCLQLFFGRWFWHVLTHVLFADDVPISDPPVLDWGKFGLLQVRRSPAVVADVSGSCHRCTTFGRRTLRYFWTRRLLDGSSHLVSGL